MNMNVPDGKMVIKVLFVCHGNICRSPLGEFIFKDMVFKKGLQDSIEVASCGTSTEHVGDPVDRRSRAELEKHGISCEGKRSRTLTEQDFKEYDYMLAMDRYNLDNLLRRRPPSCKAVIRLLMDYADGGIVEDPYFTLDFEKAYSDVEKGCRGLMKEIEKGLQ